MPLARKSSESETITGNYRIIKIMNVKVHVVPDHEQGDPEMAMSCSGIP